jgi:Transposase
MPAQRKYPEELRERAVKMVFEVRDRDGKGHGEIARVAGQLDVHREALRTWIRQADIDGGVFSGCRGGGVAGKPRLTGWRLSRISVMRARWAGSGQSMGQRMPR